MELIFIYIKNYRTFQEQQIHLTDKFQVTRDENGIKVVKNENYQNIFPDHISNVNVILGKNASGKTSLMELIGNKVETRFQQEEQIPLIISTPVDSIDKDIFTATEQDSTLLSNYFMMYHEKLRENGEDRFFIEGNNIRVAEELLNGGKEFTDRTYFWSKVWHLFKFKIDDEGNPHSAHMSDDIISVVKKEFQIFLFKKDSGNTDLSDESKIMIPRRQVNLDSFSVEDKIHFLINSMKNRESKLYNNEKYLLKCDFSNYLDIEAGLEEPDIGDDLSLKLCQTLKNYSIPEQFVVTYLYHFYRKLCRYHNLKQNQQQEFQPLDELFDDAETVKYQEFTKAMLDVILHLEEKRHIDSEYTENLKIELPIIVNSLEQMFQSCSFRRKCETKNNLEYDIQYLTLLLKFRKDSEITELHDLFHYLIDDRKVKMITERPHHGRLNTEILHLSEGERTNLSLFTAIDEQITSFSPEKNHYIILLDEVEQSMHPEMCRRFLSDLMKFLKNYPNKIFQIIISSHSPFLISDLPCSSVIRLKKNDGVSIALCNKASAPTFGQNIHTILKNDFFLSHTCGEYALSMIKK